MVERCPLLFCLDLAGDGAGRDRHAEARLRPTPHHHALPSRPQPTPLHTAVASDAIAATA